ncbi:hypothetical protein BO82DRAFT_411749, partial [Aspergillus uvarum CBS 121591]
GHGPPGAAVRDRPGDLRAPPSDAAATRTPERHPPRRRVDRKPAQRGGPRGVALDLLATRPRHAHHLPSPQPAHHPFLLLLHTQRARPRHLHPVPRVHPQRHHTRMPDHYRAADPPPPTGGSSRPATVVLELPATHTRAHQGRCPLGARDFRATTFPPRRRALQLPVAAYPSPRAWKDHVMGDLEGYVCLYETCSSSKPWPDACPHACPSFGA